MQSSPVGYCSQISLWGHFFLGYQFECVYVLHVSFVGESHVALIPYICWSTGSSLHYKVGRWFLSQAWLTFPGLRENRWNLTLPVYYVFVCKGGDNHKPKNDPRLCQILDTLGPGQLSSQSSYYLPFRDIFAKRAKYPVVLQSWLKTTKYGITTKNRSVCYSHDLQDCDSLFDYWSYSKFIKDTLETELPLRGVNPQGVLLDLGLWSKHSGDLLL